MVNVKTLKIKKKNNKKTLKKPFTKDKIEIYNENGLDLLKRTNNESINLILTDPPYVISNPNTGLHQISLKVKSFRSNGTMTKTEKDWSSYKRPEEWERFMNERNIPKQKQEKVLEKYKDNYLKFGTIYGSKYGVTTDYGKWDSKFTLEKLQLFVNEYYRVLKNGGSIIIFFDIWKLESLKAILETAGFKQIRFIEWIKTNAQPLNSSVNYLTNNREVALTAVKGSKPTFYSKYDHGIYEFPIAGGKDRFHPTQKNVLLFEELIKKHSNENDVVMDTFLGSGTTALACHKTNRKFVGSELDKTFFKKIKRRF